MTTLTRHRCFKMAACAAVAGVFACMGGPVLSQEFEWEADLRKQLQDEHQCELNYMTGAGTIEIVGKQTVVARAHCEDSRAFDVQRQEGQAHFEIQSCAQVAC